MGVLNEIRREFIAVPDANKYQIVYKWPDLNIRKYARTIVEPDAVAVFMAQGQVHGVLPPGQHKLDSTELPFLGTFIDWVSNSDAFRAEIYFIGTREFPNNRYGGRIDEVQDPQTGLVVTLRAFGEFALKVSDPTKLLLNLVGTIDVTNNDAVTGWVSEQLLKVTRTAVTTQLLSGSWSVLGLSSHLPEIEHATLAAADAQLETYGLTVSRLGNLDINLDDADDEKLKKLAGDTAYSRLAGSFVQAAQGEALQGAGEGMAKGGGAVSPMFLGAGLGMAGNFMGAPGQPGPTPPPTPGFAGGGAGFVQPSQNGNGAPATVPSVDGAPVPEGGSTSPSSPSAAGPATCPKCHAELRPGAKFCDSCGTAVGPVMCANCHAELRLGAKFCDSCGTALSAE